MKTHTCYLVADYIIKKFNEYNANKPITEQMCLNINKLQRLLYFCDIEYMKLNNGEFMFEDDFYAWPKGPAIPQIYSNFAHTQDMFVFSAIKSRKGLLTDKMKNTIDSVLELMMEIDSIDLTKISQIENGPWYNAYKADDPKHSQVISKKDMFDFYKITDVFLSRRWILYQI